MQRFLGFAIPLCACALLVFPSFALADTSFAQLLTQLEQEYQLPSGILWKVAFAESGGKANVCASTSSACGMFQFTRSTWLADTKSLFGAPLDLSERGSPNLSAKAAAYELATIRTQDGSLISQAKVDLSAGLYLGYFLGSGGAKTLLQAYMQNPAQSACALLPAQCGPNQSVMASRSVSQLVNWAAQKMQVSGVPNVPGNFACSNGTSYAYSSCDVTASNFLPANTVIPPNPYGQYATVFPPATNGAIPPAATGTSAPVSPQTVTQITSASSTASSTSSLSCTPQYFCANNTLTYESSSCTTQTVQMCQYGCSGAMCAAATSSPSSIASLFTNAQNTVTTVWQALSPASTTGTGQGFPFGSNLYTVLGGGSPAPADNPAATTSDILAGNEVYSQETFTPDYSQNFSAAPTPLSGLFTQLQSVLTGLLAYLRSL